MLCVVCRVLHVLLAMYVCCMLLCVTWSRAVCHAFSFGVLCVVCSALCIVRCALCIVRARVVCVACCVLCAVYCALRVVYCVLCAVLCAVCCVPSVCCCVLFPKMRLRFGVLAELIGIRSTILAPKVWHNPGRISSPGGFHPPGVAKMTLLSQVPILSSTFLLHPPQNSPC